MKWVSKLCSKRGAHKHNGESVCSLVHAALPEIGVNIHNEYYAVSDSATLVLKRKIWNCYLN